MKIRLLVLTLLIIGVHQHIQAQYMLGTTGMMNIPTADRQKPGTVMLGGNYLPKQMMPARFDYNTGNYFVSISFFSFLELAYRETLIKGTIYHPSLNTINRIVPTPSGCVCGKKESFCRE